MTVKSHKAIFEAIQNGDLNYIRENITNSEEANLDLEFQDSHLTYDKKNRTILDLACLFGQDKIIEYLIARGADVNKRSKLGTTPLQTALKENNTTIARNLLDHGVIPNFSHLIEAIISCKEFIHPIMLHHVDKQEILKQLSFLDIKALGQKKDIREGLRIFFDYSAGLDLCTLSRTQLNTLRALIQDANSFCFIGVSYKGKPITKQDLAALGFKNANLAIVTLKDLEHVEKERSDRILSYLEKVKTLYGDAVINEDGLVNLIPLFAAAYIGDLETITKRLNHNKQINPGDVNPFIIAIEQNHPEVVHLLLEKGRTSFSILANAMYQENITEALKKAIQQHILNTENINAEINTNLLHSSGTMLHLGAQKVDFEFVKALLDRGANPNAQDKKGRTPIELIIKNIYHHPMDEKLDDAIKLMSLLFSRGATIDLLNIHTSPLLLLFDQIRKVLGRSSMSDVETLLNTFLEFIKNRVDINVKDSAGKNILFKIASRDFAAIYPIALHLVEKLIQLGLRPNDADNEGQTICHYLAKQGFEAAHSYHKALLDLLESHIDFNAKDNLGNTPLHYVRHSGEEVSYWISKGADYRSQNNDGNTPLHEICKSSDSREALSLVKELLNHELDLDIVNLSGQKAEDLLKNDCWGNIIEIKKLFEEKRIAKESAKIALAQNSVFTFAQAETSSPSKQNNLSH